jgi:hypothetical protein
MTGVRLITLIGFVIALTSVFLIGRVDPLISAAVGLLGMVISGIALVTSKKTK